MTGMQAVIALHCMVGGAAVAVDARGLNGALVHANSGIQSPYELGGFGSFRGFTVTPGRHWSGNFLRKTGSEAIDAAEALLLRLIKFYQEPFTHFRLTIPPLGLWMR